MIGSGAFGAGLSIVVLSLTWGRVSIAAVPAGAVSVSTSVLTGRDAAPAAFAASWAALAGLGVMLLVGGTTRRWVGALVAFLGLGIVAAAVDAWSHLSQRAADQLAGLQLSAGLTVESVVTVTPAWAGLLVFGGALVVAAGCAAAAFGQLWGSSASERRSSSPAAGPDPWASLDAGVDPTADPQ